jgi:hypothetical protein
MSWLSEHGNKLGGDVETMTSRQNERSDKNNEIQHRGESYEAEVSSIL